MFLQVKNKISNNPMEKLSREYSKTEKDIINYKIKTKISTICKVKRLGRYDREETRRAETIRFNDVINKSSRR